MPGTTADTTVKTNATTSLGEQAAPAVPERGSSLQYMKGKGFAEQQEALEPGGPVEQSTKPQAGDKDAAPARRPWQKAEPQPRAGHGPAISEAQLRVNRDMETYRAKARELLDAPPSFASAQVPRDPSKELAKLRAKTRKNPTPSSADAAELRKLEDEKTAVRKAKEEREMAGQRIDMKRLPQEQLAALMYYTGPGYTPMNDVLRKTAAPDVSAAYAPVVRELMWAMATLPDVSPDKLKGLVSTRSEVCDARDDEKARDAVEEKRLGKKLMKSSGEKKQAKALRTRRKARAEDETKVTHVFRDLRLDDRYAATFRSYGKGALLHEPGFLSTSKTRAYDAASSIHWRISDPQGGKAIRAASDNKGSEDEVLFRPNTYMQITDIQWAWDGNLVMDDLQEPGDRIREYASVDSPAARFPKDDKGKHAWNDPRLKSWVIDLKMLARSDKDDALDLGEEGAEG